jgi:hypothetical protein
MSQEKKNKKKFKETKLGQFLLGKSGVFQTVADTIPSKGFLGVLKQLIVKDDTLVQKDKDVALEMLKYDMSEMEAVTRRWESDNLSDSWLSKNIRPLTLVFTSIMYAAGFFLEYDLQLYTQIYLLVIGSYFGGRSFEKINKL